MTKRLVNQCNIGEGHIAGAQQKQVPAGEGRTMNLFSLRPQHNLCPPLPVDLSLAAHYVHKKRSSGNAAIFLQTMKRYSFKQCSDIPSNNAAIFLQTMKRYSFKQ
jgi:hypothetical protein